MLKKLSIQAYKSIEEQDFKLAPLTLLTGVNSSGKSSVIQAILMLLASYEQQNQSYINELAAPFIEFDSSHCRWSNKDNINLQLLMSSGKKAEITIGANEAQAILNEQEPCYVYENNFYYLAANRTGEEEISKFDHTLDSGSHGQFLFGTYEKLRNKPVHESIQHPNAVTPNLKAQLAYWLSRTLNQEIEFESKKISPNLVQNKFKFEDIGEISPRNVGAGNSYITKLLILGLISQPGHLLIIENPEIHLHPKAQARLAEFFAYLAKNGVQLIIETHSEHFLNGVRYQVYKQKIAKEHTTVYYKPGMKENFINLNLNINGHYVDEENKLTNFPQGFFDATLAELLEMG